MMSHRITFIILIFASFLIIFPVFYSKSKIKKKLNENIIYSLVAMGIIIFLISFYMHPPFVKSKVLVNNKFITKNYTNRLKNDAKTALITSELLKNKFLGKDTLYFKGMFNTGDEIKFGVLILISDSISDSIIQIDYKLNYSDTSGKIICQNGNGYIQLKHLRIIFNEYNIGTIEINNVGKIVLNSDNKDEWRYTEF